MKLAEALQERADLNRKIEELRRRLGNVILVKVGGMTLTEMIARKDALMIKLSAYRDLVYTAGQNTSRARGTEIKVKALLKAGDLQKTADKIAKEVRELDNLLQETNWKTKLIEG